MFDFLFRRATKPAVPALPAQVHSTAASLQQVARETARAQASALAHDEAGCVDFLLVCEFADARLIAAQPIQSREALQRVLKAVRNTDRRVARLMQSRLDAVESQHKVAELAALCITDASAMTAQPLLTPQRVGDIDRRWAALAAPSQEQRDAFGTVRDVLGKRLVAQSDLQRKVIDTLARLRQLIEGSSSLSVDEQRATLEQYEADVLHFGLSVEAINLPKNLLDQCRLSAQEARQALAAVMQRESRLAALSLQLQQWEAALLVTSDATIDPTTDATTNSNTAVTTLDATTLQRDWHALVKATSAPAELHVRFAALMERVTTNRAAKNSSALAAVPATTAATAATAASASATVVASEADPSHEWLSAMQALEQALAQGALQQALDADRRLRAISPVVAHGAAQVAHLSRLRIELSQLQGWARWGGGVSRDELQKAAIALPTQSFKLVELAKKIGNLRQQWKALDATAGPASKEAWHSFDAACTAAYAPVAEHHQVLSQARQQNSVLAQQQIAALEKTADALIGHDATSTNDAIDWKSIAQCCQRAQQEWLHIGPTERRDKQTLDRQFNTALQRLLRPLGVVQQAEQALRLQMIASASQLQAQQPGTLDALRTLQQQWQERARAVPLERRDEQTLWLKFRAACDAVFAQRKEAAAADDLQRKTNLRTREALCMKLEEAGVQPNGALAALLRDTAAAWSACGAVPRAAQEALESRYRRALAAIEKHTEAIQRTQADTRRQITRQKLQLCQRLDAALLNASAWPVDLVEQLASAWQKLTAASTKLDTALTHRFEQALLAHSRDERSYVQQLMLNQSIVQHELLRLEIVLSLESPVELARDRLKMQVEVLQSALRMGQQTASESDQLSALCALPVVIDGETLARFDRVVARHLA